jgi:hypothetical protein
MLLGKFVSFDYLPNLRKLKNETFLSDGRGVVKRGGTHKWKA